MTIEAKRYVANDADIRELATEMFSAVNAGRKSRTTYLRALVGTTQAELKDKSATQEDQRRALKAVQERFKAVVLKVVDEEIADVPKKQQATERNRRMNFARTAYGVVRSWLRAEGNDLFDLKVDKVSKNELVQQAAARNPHKPTLERTHNKVTKYVGNLVTAAKAYAVADAAGAREFLEEAIRELTAAARTLKQGTSASPMVSTMTSRRAAKAAKSEPALHTQRTISKKAA